MQQKLYTSPWEGSFRSFHFEAFPIESRILPSFKKKRAVKNNLVLFPKTRAKNYPLVFILPGFGGSPPSFFKRKPFFSFSKAEILDRMAAVKKAPKAVYVVVDAMTLWGGSQFINSPLGNYEDYLVRELFFEIKKRFSINSKKVCVMGASSGGYGALHLSSKYGGSFPYVAALAPDSLFELSLLPECYKALPIIKKMGGVRAIENQLKKKTLKSKSESFLVLNALAMAFCYGEKVSSQVFPIQKNGDINKKAWNFWKEKDPIVFLQKRKGQIKKIKAVYLSSGKFDEFFLQYGTRKIEEILKKQKVKVSFFEFEGGHFQMEESFRGAWKWLNRQWT